MPDIAETIISRLFNSCVEGRVSPLRETNAKLLEDAVLRLTLHDANTLMQHFRYGITHVVPGYPPVTGIYHLLFQRLRDDFNAALAEEKSAGLLHLIPDQDGEIGSLIVLLEGGTKLEFVTGARMYYERHNNRDHNLVIHFSDTETMTTGFTTSAVKEAVRKINCIIERRNMQAIAAFKEAKAMKAA